MREYSVVAIADDGEYGQEILHTRYISEALEAVYYSKIEGVQAEILKLTPLRDVYGVETDECAWIPLDAAHYMEDMQKGV